VKLFDNKLKTASLAIMEKLSLEQADNQWLNKVTEESGIIRFYAGEDLLYVREAVNLKKVMAGLKSQAENDITVAELFKKADGLSLEETETALEALLKTKAGLEKDKPEFNLSINTWKNYVYLAINPAEFPFVKISEYTEEDWFYLGPFRSRFFLVDMMELVQKLIKLPFCEVKSGPCEKLDNNLCRGWCELVMAEAKEAQEDFHSHPHLEKLDALLKEAYVHPDNGMLEMFEREKEKYDVNLQFAKADLLKPQIELLRHYKEWLIFLYKIKNLNVVTDKITVRNGQLIHYKIDGQEFDNPFLEIDYRQNEILALNKNLLDEARILYQESKA
jgi:excinuclease UvrABC nuclease subunit